MGYDPGRFLNSLGEFWTCPKCTLVLREPIQICDNSHSICSSCSPSIPFPQCPVAGCSGTILDETNRRPDATASRFLSSQMIKCVNSSNVVGSADPACEWVGTVTEENMHAITCAFAATGCPHPGCTFRAPSSALPNHLRTCPYRLVRCPNSNLNTLGGSPRKGCAYKGSLNTMDQHLVDCTYNPCPQSCYGCLFTNTIAMVEQHASECKDLLFRELCELRKRVASQQGPTPPTAPPALPAEQPTNVTAGDNSMDTEHTNNHTGQEDAPFLMTPPSTNIPSSELGANEHNPFDATVIAEDASNRQRSSSILDLDVDIEDTMEGAQPDAMARPSASDHEMEDGEVSVFGDEAELLVEAISEDEEEHAEEDESGEEDVLKEIGIKAEFQDRGIAICVTEDTQQPDFASSDSMIPASPLVQQGSDTPTILSPAKVSTRTSVTAGRPGAISRDPPGRKRKNERPTSNSVPRTAAPTRQASGQNSSQVECPPDSNSPTVHVETTMNSSTILGYGYMEHGQIFPRPLVPHDPPRESPREEVPLRTSRIKMVRDVGLPPPAPDTDAFGPIRTNMHRRTDAISHGRGSHPYLSNGAHPRQMPPGPPNGSGPGRRAPGFPPTGMPSYMEGNYHFPGAMRGSSEYQGYPPNAPGPPPYNWPSRQYAGGPPIPASAPSRGYPPQMRRDFEWEGFEASREYRGTFDTRMTQASSRRPFSTHRIEADYVHPQYRMHPYENLAMDSQLRSGRRDVHHYPPSWYPNDPASCEHDHSNMEDCSQSFTVTPKNTFPSRSSTFAVPPTKLHSKTKPPPSSAKGDAMEGTDLEPHSRPEAKSASPVVVSIPPQKRPPKVSATPLKPINRAAKPTHPCDDDKRTHGQKEAFTPSLLAQPPIEYLQELSSKKAHREAKEVSDGNIAGGPDGDPSLAQNSSVTQTIQSPPKRSVNGVVHKRKKSAKSVEGSPPAKTTRQHKEDNEMLVTNISANGTSSPTKSFVTTKGRFVNIPEEEFLARDTLVDRPPKLFPKRVTRSGKEFHSGDDESKSDSADDPEVAVESLESKVDVPVVQGTKAQILEAMETVRSPSGIKTRGLKAIRKIGSRPKSSVQLAVPITRGPAEDDIATAMHSDVSEASNSSKDLFVPARRMTVDVKRDSSSPLKLKLPNPSGRGRGRGRGRGIGRGQGKAEAWGPRSVQDRESIKHLEDASGSEAQEQGGDVDLGQDMFMSGSTASNISFPISHSRTTVMSSKDAPSASSISPSRLLAAHSAAQNMSSTGSLGLIDFLSGLGTSNPSPVTPTVITSIAPSSTWNAYASTGQLGTDEDSRLASSMDFEFDPFEQLQLDEWTHLADYQDTMNEDV